MNWNLKLILTIFSLIILVFITNFVIDPYGGNLIFNLKNINQEKTRIDERVKKFNHLSKNQYDTLIFGSSRTTILNPKIFSVNAYNSSFSAATIDEIHEFIRYSISENPTLKSIYLGLDLFSLDSSFKSNGKMPLELSLEKSKVKKYINFLNSYIGISTFKDSFKTIKHNLNSKEKTLSELKYENVGMRYYKSYLSCKKNISCLNDYIYKNVTSRTKSWHSDGKNQERLHYLEKIKKITNANNINLTVFLNPILFDQIDKYPKIFKRQLELLKKLAISEYTIYDCNPISQYNRDHHYYIDIYHYNYKVSDIIAKDLIGANKPEKLCKRITKDNFQAYINTTLNKL